MAELKTTAESYDHCGAGDQTKFKVNLGTPIHCCNCSKDLIVELSDDDGELKLVTARRYEGWKVVCPYCEHTELYQVIFKPYGKTCLKCGQQFLVEASDE